MRPISNSSSRFSRTKLMGCKLLAPIQASHMFTSNVGSDGLIASWATFVAASRDVYGALWTNYQRHSMRLMSER